MRFETIAACLFACLLPAQGDLDLRSLAKESDPGERPDVIALIPKELRKAAATAFGDVKHEVLRRAMTIDGGSTDAAGLAAIAVLDLPRAAAPNAEALWLESRACELWAARSRLHERWDAATGRGAAPEWLSRVGTAAQRRSDSLRAELLRDHSETTAASRTILSWHQLRSQLTDPQLDAVRSRLGEAANGEDLRCYAHELLIRDRLADLPQALDDLVAWGKMNAQSAGVEAIEYAHDLRLRAARAAALPPLRDEDGAALHNLERLQLTDSGGAVRAAKALVAANVEDARPYAIVAAERFLSGDHRQALELLERAASRPGKCTLYATLQLLLRVLPSITQESPDAEAVAANAVAWDDFAELLRGNDSAEAAFMLWLRAQQQRPRPPESRKNAFPDAALAEALALRDAHPDVPEFTRLVFVSACAAADAEAGGKALLQGLPAEVSQLPSLHLDHASALFAWGARQDVQAIDETFRRALNAAEAAGADPRDTAYLRGVHAWLSAVRLSADGVGRNDAATQRSLARQSLVDAQKHFTRARKQPGELGYARHEHAHLMLCLMLGEPYDGPRVEVLFLRDGSPASRRPIAPYFVPEVLGIPLTNPVPPEFDRASTRKLAPSDGATVLAALAAAHSGRGDNETAARYAREALKSLNDAVGGPAGYTSGLLITGHMHWQIAVRDARAVCQVEFALEPWVVTPTPPLTLLRQWAAK